MSHKDLNMTTLIFQTFLKIDIKVCIIYLKDMKIHVFDQGVEEIFVLWFWAIYWFILHKSSYYYMHIISMKQQACLTKTDYLKKLES